MERLVGFMGERAIGARKLWIPDCSSIHTCFMEVPIDAVFLDPALVIVSVHPWLRPWRVVRGGKGADSVLEGAAGFAESYGLAPGVSVEWR